MTLRDLQGSCLMPEGSLKYLKLSDSLLWVENSKESLVVRDNSGQQLLMV